MYAIGGNENAAQVAGVNVRGSLIRIYILAGCMYALAGFLVGAKAGGASTATGNGYELEAIAACTIGGVSANGGVGRVGGILIGVLAVESTEKLPFVYTTDTTLGDVKKDSRAWEIVKGIMSKGLFSEEQGNSEGESAAEAMTQEMNDAMVEYMPLRGPISFGGQVTMADVQALVDKLNALEE